MFRINVLFMIFQSLLLFYWSQSKDDCTSHEKIINKKLQDKVIKTVLQIGPTQCSKLCSTISGCLSFNYERMYLKCSLNYVNQSLGILVTENGVDYYEKKFTTTDGCSQTTCSKYSQCIDLTSGPHCAILSCPEPAAIDNAILQPGDNSVGSTRRYSCAVYHIPQGTTSTTCLTSGEWSQTTLYCKPIRSCAEIKACNSQYGNGEYWFYPSGANNSKIKIYCDKMSTNQSEEYITLPNTNKNEIDLSKLTSTNPCTWNTGIFTRSVFQKIRINPENMVVTRNDTTFATLTEDPTGRRGTPDYAYGLGCAKESTTGTCRKLGYIRIDTTGTGLIVSPDVTFHFGGYKPVPGSVTKSNDGLVIEVRCDGSCGYCYPDGDLVLIPSNIPVPENAAVHPQCP